MTSNQKLANVYESFFNDFDINKTTGILQHYPEIKFMTMPYIGSKYDEAKYKILFVGMDVGKDESSGKFHSLEDRRKSIETDNDFNPHIAGTYGAALYLLEQEHKWQDAWEKMKTFNTFQIGTKRGIHSDNQNPLSFVALTNLHKFVTVSRLHRSGGENRKFLKAKVEEKLLLDEIDILRPQLVLFQGKLPSQSAIEELRKRNLEIILAPHPSNRKKNGRNPTNYISSFREIGTSANRR